MGTNRLHEFSPARSDSHHQKVDPVGAEGQEETTVDFLNKGPETSLCLLWIQPDPDLIDHLFELFRKLAGDPFRSMRSLQDGSKSASPVRIGVALDIGVEVRILA